MVAEHNQHCEQTLMFTDIVGYSRLMGRNESMAIEMLGEYRKILLSHIEAQGGQLVEFIGDAIFARFNSAASATAAAIAIQQHLQAFNEVRDKKLPPLQTRIGLHKGEVMLRDGAVFGDSVNIAARLEPLAVAEGICISQTVYDEVRITLSSPAKRLGVQALKNIEQKIRVYLIKPSGIGWRDHLFYFLRGLNKKIHAYRYPLTACLLAFIVAGFYFIPRWLVPGYTANYVEIADFQNLMNEKGDADYFSAGITAAVRSQLADMRDVYIVDAKEGVHAPIRLEGSVQRLGDNLRIAYRLFRRKDNVQIAGGKLDGTYQDIFILQDRLVGEIARYLADEFDLQNFRPAPLRLTNDIAAYDYYLQGLGYLNKPSLQENFDAAIQLFNQALVHDENFALANSGICEVYRRKYAWVRSSEWLTGAESYCLKAVKQNEKSIKTYVTIASLYRDTGRFDRAIEYLKNAIEIDGDNVSAIIALAGTYGDMGFTEKAESLFSEAKIRHPKHWEVYQENGYFYYRQGRFEEAIKNYEIVLKLTPDNLSALHNLGGIYIYLGDFKKATIFLHKAADLEPSARTFSNIGSMYYYMGNFDKSISYYKKALSLEPANVEYMANIADAYYFFSDNKKNARKFFNDVQLQAEADLRINPKNVENHLYLALSFLYQGKLYEAKESIKAALSIDNKYVFSHYVNLRLAIVENNESNIRTFVMKLREGGYSKELILADPYFWGLKDKRFSGVFN